MDDVRYSINDVMRHFGVGRKTVKKWISDGSLRAKTMPARSGYTGYFITESDFDAFAENYDAFRGNVGYKSINDVARTFGVHKATVTQWILRGWLRAENNGKSGHLIRYKIKDEEIEIFRNGAYKNRWSAIKEKNRLRGKNGKFSQ